MTTTHPPNHSHYQGRTYPHDVPLTNTSGQLWLFDGYLHGRPVWRSRTSPVRWQLAALIRHYGPLTPVEDHASKAGPGDVLFRLAREHYAATDQAAHELLEAHAAQVMRRAADIVASYRPRAEEAGAGPLLGEVVKRLRAASAEAEPAG